jgi:hypothetical protein
MENVQSADRSESVNNLKTEVLLLLGLVALGMWLVPALIYLVGSEVLGPYGEIQTISAFYLDLFGFLIAGRGIAWLLVTSPYLFLCVIRLLAWLWGVAQRTAAKKRARTTE